MDWFLWQYLASRACSRGGRGKLSAWPPCRSYEGIQFMSYAVVGAKSLRSGLLLSAASAAVASLSVPVLAQQAAPVETVVVTGSRIPQQGLYGTSPVTAIGQQQMKLQGTPD